MTPITPRKPPKLWEVPIEMMTTKNGRKRSRFSPKSPFGFGGASQIDFSDNQSSKQMVVYLPEIGEITQLTITIVTITSMVTLQYLILDLRLFDAKGKKSFYKYSPKWWCKMMMVYHGIESVKNHQLNKSKLTEGLLIY